VFENAGDQSEAVAELAKDKSLKVPLTVVPKDKLEATAKLYKIDKTAKNTLMVYKGKKVQFNAVDVKPEGFSKVAEAAKKALTD